MKKIYKITFNVVEKDQDTYVYTVSHKFDGTKLEVCYDGYGLFYEEDLPMLSSYGEGIKSKELLGQIRNSTLYEMKPEELIPSPFKMGMGFFQR